MKKSDTKKKTEDLRNDELLRDDLLAEALRDAGLDVEGTTVEKALRLEAHYLALPEPAGWNSKPHHKGGQGAWHLTCEIAKNGCGYTSTAKQECCVFCGDGQAEAPKPVKDGEGMVVHRVVHRGGGGDGAAIEGELLEHEDGVPAPDGEPSGTVEELDEAIRVIHERKRALEAGERSLTGNEWDLGHAIYTVFKKTLYVQRRKDGGGPLYSSWPQFCKAELPFGAATANRYMRVATNFTRELAQDLGPSKLVELLPAAEAQAAEDQIALRLGRAAKVILPPLLERARVVSVPDLRAEVRAAMPKSTKTGKGHRDTTNATAAAAAKKLASKKPEAERVTVQRQEGTVKMAFYLDEKAARAGDKKRLAKKFADGAVCIEPAVNGVECVYTLKLDANRGPLLSRKVVRVE